jgi:hypothetical protein
VNQSEPGIEVLNRGSSVCSVVEEGSFRPCPVKLRSLAVNFPVEDILGLSISRMFALVSFLPFLLA